MSIVTEIELDVDTPQAKSIYKSIEQFRHKHLNPLLMKRINPLVESILSSAEPSTRVLIKDKPEIRVKSERADQISILTANLWHDWPRYRDLEKRLECFTRVVKEEKVDVILLQELARTENFAANEWLSEELGMAYVFSRANGSTNGIGFEEGLGVFSQFPIRKPRLAQLSDQRNPFVRRIALGATIEAPMGDFLAFSVHLGLNGHQNKEQVSRLIEWVERESKNTAAVIGGDFNARENTSQIREAKNFWHDSYRDVNPETDGFTHRIKWPWGGNIIESRLDYLFLKRGIKPWSILEARHIDNLNCDISDHKPVLIRTRIER